MECNGRFDIDVNYYTAEMPVDALVGEFQAFWLFKYHKHLVDTKHIYSIGNSKIDSKIYDILTSKECEDITNEFEKKVNIVNESISSGFIYKEANRLATKHGDVKWRDKENLSKGVESYKEKNPHMFQIGIVDNYQRLFTAKGQTQKEAIDTTSKYLDRSRQVFNQTWVALNQINRNTKNLDRYKLGQFFPGPESLKDSEQPYHDCQICIVLISPKDLGLNEFNGYQITPSNGVPGLMDRIRPFKILKNRDGLKKVGFLGFIGEVAYFWELPSNPTKLKSDYYKELESNIIHNIVKTIRGHYK